MTTIQINHAMIERIAGFWPKRSTVRSTEFYDECSAAVWDRTAPDFPVGLTPFGRHPAFLNADPRLQAEILTLAWLVYNERVITAETHVANPALELVQRGVFPGVDTPAFQDAVQQTLIDEHWHTHMHQIAMRRTIARRGVECASLAFPKSVTYRALLRAQAEASETWERDLLTLVWTVVSEISINALLSLLARDQTIQPLHRMVTAMHAKDETTHGAIMVEVTKALWPRMNARQRDGFTRVLPLALESFAAQDFSAWEVIVDRVGLPGGRKMLADAACDSNSLLVRDYSGLERLATTLGVRDRIDFDFPPPRPELEEVA
jgi:4-aminobenzoate N-oxygenase